MKAVVIERPRKPINAQETVVRVVAKAPIARAVCGRFVSLGVGGGVCYGAE